MYQYSSTGNHKTTIIKKFTLSELNILALEQMDIKFEYQGMYIVKNKVIVQMRITFLDYNFGGCEISP